MLEIDGPDASPEAKFANAESNTPQLKLSGASFSGAFNVVPHHVPSSSDSMPLAPKPSGAPAAGSGRALPLFVRNWIGSSPNPENASEPAGIAYATGSASPRTQPK